MKFRSIVGLFVVVILLMISVCGCSLFKTDYPVTVGTVEIKEQPLRVATLSEAAASSIYALGYPSYLVGAPSTFLRKGMEGVTDLGNPVVPNKEALYTLAPDVLITATEPDAAFAQELNLRNITVVTLKTPEKYSEVAAYYTELCKLFVGKEKYDETVSVYLEEMERVLGEIKKSNQALTQKALVLLEEGFVVTPDTLGGEAMKKAGIPNAATGQHYRMSEDAIKKANPDVMFVPTGQSETLLKNKSFADITAIKNGAVYEVDWIALCYAGEGFVATLQDMTTYMKQ